MSDHTWSPGKQAQPTTRDTAGKLVAFLRDSGCDVTVTTSVKGIRLAVTQTPADDTLAGQWTVLVTPVDVANETGPAGACVHMYPL